MKRISQQIILLIAAIIGTAILSSCSTTEKFYINSSVPANVTYTSVKNAREIKSINVQPGIPTEIEIPSNMYLGYVVAKDPATGLEMPVGLNLHENIHKKNKTLGWLGFSAYPIGAGLMGAGIALADANPGIGMSLSILGPSYMLGMGLYGILAWQFRAGQISYIYKFGYDKEQVVDFSGLSAKILYPDPPKDFEDSTGSALANDVSSGNHFRKETGTNTPVKTTKIKAKDAASLAAGTYAGSGQLILDDETTDTYPNMEIEIVKVGKNLVSVTVKTDGEEFFESPLTCQVKKNKDGSLNLQLQDTPTVYIRISKNGNLSFSHRSIQVDNDIYTLNIQGEKR